LFSEDLYFEYLHKVTDPSLCMAIQVALKYLLLDFRNPLPQTRLKQFETAYKNGEATADLLLDLINFIRSPGGPRKPDILGIIAEGDPGRFDLHEVCTVGTLSATKAELNSKLYQLQTQVIPLLENELRARQVELRVTPQDPLIHTFAADASTWAPPKWLRNCPLGIDFDAQKNVIKVKWACFEPAVDPSNQALVNPGLLPYHIHEIEGPELEQILPAAVRVDLKRWEGEMAMARGLRPLQLLPQVNPAIQSGLASLTAENRQLLAYGALAVLVVVLCVVAAPIVLDPLILALSSGAGAPAVAAAPTLAVSMPGAVVSAPAVIAEAPAAVATTQGLYPLVEQYAMSLARAAQSLPAPPP
jgi:hypothetical protein